MEANSPLFKTRDELGQCSKEDLINLVLKLQTTLEPNVLEKPIKDVNGSIENDQQKFELPRYPKRRVLLKLFYLSSKFQSFVKQNRSSDTVEHHLFHALEQTYLIESRESSNFYRCGSIGNDASGFSDVISIDLRSNFPALAQMTDESIQNEIRYCDVLNRVLPANIRLVAWKPLHNREFDSHLDCSERVYRYFFPGSNLYVDAMRKACGYLVGRHDFRNLCEMDAGDSEEAYVCELSDVRVFKTTGSSGKNSPYDMYCVEFVGKEFLPHQIRAIMAILLLIGQQKENPEIMYHLLDIERNPRRPPYTLAADYPLCLYDVKMEEYSKCTVPTGELIAETKNWIYDTDTLGQFIGNLQQQWTQFSVKSQVILEMLHGLTDVYEKELGQKRIHTHCDTLHESGHSKKALLSIDRTLKLDILEVEYCELIFEYLMLNDLVSLGQTCKRLNQVVGKVLHENYPGIRYDCREDGIYIYYSPYEPESEFDESYNEPVIDRKFFHNYISELNVVSKGVQYLCNFQPKLPQIRRMVFHGIRLPTIIPDSLKAVFSRLTHLILGQCELDGNFYELVLAFCPKLTHLTVFGEKPTALVGNTNDWLSQRYPTIEYFELTYKYEINAELKTFLELNPNIRKFVIHFDYEPIGSDLWLNADVKLDELEVIWIYSFNNELHRQLNKLYERGFYKRLSLTLLERVDPLDDTIKGLVNLNLPSEDFLSIQSSMLEELEELWIGFNEALNDSSTLPNTCKKLKRLTISHASSDEILPFIRYSLGIKSIYVETLYDGHHFENDTKIIDLVALNMERAKLIGAQKVTIYVEDMIYVASKWAVKETDLSLIRLQRRTSQNFDF